MAETPNKRQRFTADLFFEVPVENTNKLDKIESLIDVLKSENERLSIKIKSHEITHQQALQEKTAKIVELVTQNAEIKKQAIYHMDRFEKATETLAAMKAKHSQVTNVLRDSLNNERENAQAYRNELAAKKYEFEQKEIDINGAIEEQSLKNTELSKANAHLVKTNLEKSDIIVSANQREKELIDRMNQLQDQLNRRSIYPGNSEPYEVLQDQYESISKCATELELENQKLGRDLKHFKSVSQNVELLRREKESLEYQVKELEKIRESKIAFEMENIKLRLERDSWASYIDNLQVNTQTPQSIISQLSRKVEEARHLQQAVIQYQQQTKDDMLIIEGLTKHMEELKEAAAKMQYEHAKDEAAKSVMIKGTEALKRHISILENQLNMYDQEEIHQGQYDEIKSKRIKELEELLKRHEDQILAQSQQLAEISSSSAPIVQVMNGPYEKLASGIQLTEFLSELLNKQTSLMKELQEKTIDLNMLQKQYHAINEKMKQVCQISNTTKESDTRILQLIDNPASKDLAIRKSLLERLEKENTDLLQSQINNTTCLTVTVPKSSVDNLEAKIQKLETDLEARQKHIQRLHSIFETKVQESSHRIRQLFGFTVITRPDELIRLESPWVDPAELSFLVKLDGDDSSILRMIGSKAEEYRETLYDIYQTYIIVDLNLPAFLNAAAQELYVNFKENQRMVEQGREEVEMEDIVPENHHDQDDIDLEYEEDADLYNNTIEISSSGDEDFD